MENKVISNYEKLCEQWEEKFIKMDQEELMIRLPELKNEGEYLTIYHFGRKYGINCSTGNIIAMDDDAFVYVTAKLNIYTLLAYVSPLAHLRGEWVSFEKLKDTSQFSRAFTKGILEPFAEMFTGKIDKLERAFNSLDGKKINYSDMGYEIKAFDCIPMRFLFWDADDEFDAQASILFDSSATDFTHEESIVSIAMVGLCTLANIAGIPVSSKLFPTS